MAMPQSTSAKTRRVKSNRLEARITDAQKTLISKAASLEGLSVTDFTVHHLLEISRQVVERNLQFELSCRDQEAFVLALLEPPEPNQKLREAYRDYLDTVHEVT